MVSSLLTSYLLENRLPFSSGIREPHERQHWAQHRQGCKMFEPLWQETVSNWINLLTIWLISWLVYSLGRVCPFTGKKANRANKVSFSNHKTKKLQFVNLQYKKIWWEAGKRYVKLRLSTKALKTIEKNGLDAVAKKAGIDLRKE